MEGTIRRNINGPKIDIFSTGESKYLFFLLQELEGIPVKLTVEEL